MATVRFVRPGLAVVLVWLAVAAVAAGAEVRLATCAADARLCPEATGLIHPHAPAEGTHHSFSGGVSVGDFNRDGWQDLFVVTGGAAPDRLYLNRGDGTFREAAERAGVAAVHRGHGSVIGDVDKDGWLDIFVTSFGPTAGGPAMAGHHLLWLNLGSRRGGVLADGTPMFRNIAQPALVATTSPEEPSGMGAAFGDYDGDGDLDLAVVAWRRDAAGSVLLSNEGIDEWTGLPRFLNATRRAPPVRHRDARLHPAHRRRRRRPLAGGAGGGRLRHQPPVPQQRRRHLRRRDRDSARGAGHQRHGQRARRRGQRRPARLVRHLHLDHLPVRESPNNGNYLYRNLGGGAFDPGPETRGPLARGGWGWGVAAADLDHDGLLELVTTNGSEDKNTDERQEWLEDATRVFHNRGAEGFRDMAPEAGLDHRGQGARLVRFDYDNDGDQDLLIVNSRGVPTLVANTGGAASGNWLWVELRPALDLPVPPDGVGAVVRVRAGGAAQTRHIETGGGYLGSSELSAHFGLGAAAVVDELRVEWPDGCDTAAYGVAVNRRLRLERPAGCAMEAVTLDASNLHAR